jgi:hypothetical protein
MVLSYAGLHAFYASAGFAPWSAWLAPLVIDLLTLVAYVAALTLGGWYPALVVGIGVAASAGAQGYHAANGGITAPVTEAWVLFAAGASVMLAAGLAGHLFWKILEQALPAGFISAMRATAPLYETRTLPEPASNPLHAVPTLVERPAQETLPARQAVAPRIHRPTAKAPSQQRGDCVPGCDRHPEGVSVSKSTRYLCKDRLERTVSA